MNFFSLGVTDEERRANIDWKSAFLKDEVGNGKERQKEGTGQRNKVESALARQLITR